MARAIDEHLLGARNPTSRGSAVHAERHSQIVAAHVLQDREAQHQPVGWVERLDGTREGRTKCRAVVHLQEIELDVAGAGERTQRLVVGRGAHLLAALCVDAQPGQQVLDLCAAPGGKSLTLAEAMQDKGQLVSGEFVPARVPLLQQAFDRCGITCAVAVENDATQHNSDWPTFDRVLCDVPCSGLGVIAKKPDIRYKDLDGIENLLAAQQKILQNGADSLAENGRLVYSTCTVNDKENQAQVEKFLSANPDFHVVLPKTALPGADITPLGTLFLPHRTGTDGFFAAILERN